MAGTGSRGRAERRGAGELESEVLAALWATERPLTPAEIQQEIGGGLAYNTVHTILTRLYDKGLVRRDADGRRGAYRAARNAAETTAAAMHEALDRGPDPIAALRHFVTGLDAAEERALRELLDGDRAGDRDADGDTDGTADGHGPGTGTAAGKGPVTGAADGASSAAAGGA